MMLYVSLPEGRKIRMFHACQFWAAATKSQDATYQQRVHGVPIAALVPRRGDRNGCESSPLLDGKIMERLLEVLGGYNVGQTTINHSPSHHHKYP